MGKGNSLDFALSSVYTMSFSLNDTNHNDDQLSSQSEDEITGNGSDRSHTN